MPKHNMPENWQPPAPAWVGDWQDKSEPLVVGYYGIQGASPELLDRWAAKAFTSDQSPQHIDQGKFIDTSGVTNHVFVCYWRLSAYRLWWSEPDSYEWWQDHQRIKDAVGVWREVIIMPFDNFETLNSSTVAHGVSETADDLTGPIEEHGYAGGMRDRINLSRTDTMRNERSMHQPLPASVEDNGLRVSVTLPKHTCIIRSGQNWSQCDEEQSNFYLQKVHPVLQSGMKFLANNPFESRCYTMRFVQETDTNWHEVSRSFGLGFAVDIYGFEEWAKSHPTHLAILDRFMHMVHTFGEQLGLKLWHEVTVLNEQGGECEYLCCHPKSGFLPYI